MMERQSGVGVYVVCRDGEKNQTLNLDFTLNETPEIWLDGELSRLRFDDELPIAHNAQHNDRPRVTHRSSHFAGQQLRITGTPEKCMRVEQEFQPSVSSRWLG